MITITRKFDLLFNKISKMFERVVGGTYYTVSTATIKKMSFYSDNGIIIVRFVIEPEEYSTYAIYATLLKKEDNGELNFPLKHSDYEKEEFFRLQQDVVLELCRMFTS